MPWQMKTTKYNIKYFFFWTKNLNSAKWWRNSYIDTYNIKWVLQGKYVNRADGCCHEMKVMKNILVKLSRPVTQYKNIYS